MEKLLLGVDAQIITPELGTELYGYLPGIYAKSVLDDLTVKAFAFQNGDKKVMMITASVCSIATELANEIRKKIEEKFGVPFGAIILSATHTHTGPGLVESPGMAKINMHYYDSIFLPATMKACENAWNSLQEVEMGVGQGISKLGINRREITLRNGITLGQCEWGCYNPVMTVATFRNNGKTIATILSYGAHGTALGCQTIISRDWAGVMEDKFEQAFGGVAAYFNEAEGDVGPRMSNGATGCNQGDPNAVKLMREIGDIASADAIEIMNNINSYTADVPLTSNYTKIELPFTSRMSKEMAEQIIKSAEENELVNIDARRYNNAKKTLKAIEENLPEEKFFYMPQTAVGIGKVIYIGFPCEHFSEINLRVGQAVKDKIFIGLACTNGREFAYFPTKGEIYRGGYEIAVFKNYYMQPLVDDADMYLVNGTIKNIEQMK